jgi:tRNA(Arg) A34 adenosine deaminase TadA
MSSSISRYVEIAANEAAKSDYHYRLGAVVVDHGRVVGKGCNELRTDPNLRRRGYYSVHAEIRSLMRSKGKGDTLVVVRIRKNNALTSSQPCSMCLGYAKEYGIRKIIYIDWLGNIQEMRI